MIADPWHLLASGVVLLVIGAILAVVLGPGVSPGPRIDPRMEDAEIARRLRRRPPMTFAGLVVAAGLVCLLAGLGRRLLRTFL